MNFKIESIIMKTILVQLLCMFVLLDATSCAKKTDGPKKKDDHNELSLRLILPNVAASGSMVQMQGRGFGSSQESVQVKFGDVTGEVLELSNGILSVKVPELADGAKVDVAVVVGDNTSNIKSFRVRKIEEPIVIPKDTIEWIEDKNPNIAAIEHGIASYDEQVVKYIRNGQQLLEVELGKPSLVVVAEDEIGWGFYQFPSIRRSLSGQLAIGWAMNHDDAASYGKPALGINSAVSNDGGETWVTVSRGPTSGGTLLSNGDRINISTPAAVPLAELELPNSIVTLQDQSTYGRLFTIYEYDKLPLQLQGAYQSRMRQGQTSWVAERGTIVSPNLARYADGNLFPVVWWGDIQEISDGVYTCRYPGFEINQSGGVDPAGVICYKSTDFGKTWVKQGSILYQPDLSLDPNGSKRKTLGWTEPAFAALQNGTFLSILRTADGFGKSPMYWSTSVDKGVNWSTPKVFTGAGVKPMLLELDNGIVALAAGRPGVQLRFMLNDNANDWTEPFEMLPWVDNEATLTNDGLGSSCGYAQVLKMDENSFLMVYSDFKHTTPEGLIRKAIKVRKITVKRM